MRDADPVPESPERNTLAAFVLAPDGKEPRFFLIPWVEYQLMVFWRISGVALRAVGSRSVPTTSWPGRAGGICWAREDSTDRTDG